MKKIHLLLFLFVPFFCAAQNVGIGTSTPITKLTVQTPTDNFGITHTDGTVRVGTYVGSSGGWIATQSYHPLYFSTGLLNGNNSAQMTLLTNGNFGIGTLNPSARLTVKTTLADYGFIHTDGDISLGTYIGSGMGWIGTKSNHSLAFFTNNGSPQMTLRTNGYVGIGAGANRPDNKLQIGSIGTTMFSGFDLAIGNGTNALAIVQSNAYSQFASTTNIILMPKIIGGGGRVGINVENPTNTLQVGYMGAAGFNGNDFAIGNGTNALGIFQTNTATQFASSTDIILMPRINGGGVGKVGINTSTPKYPLEVAGFNYSPSIEFAYYSIAHNHSTFEPTENFGGTTESVNVSIYASDRIMASQFNAYSDSRIKDIKGLSNSIKDLETINSLRITDYTMKDRVKYGNKLFKKVIAQEVEKIYPQVVSKHTDFIPNVYQLTSKIEKTANSYQLNFDDKHNISNTAKKLRIILKDGGTQEFNIVSIPSDTQVVVSGMEIKTDKVFVYGEEVNDFRTVDYEGLTTLNISATQELSKLIDALNKKIALLEKRVEQLETKK